MPMPLTQAQKALLDQGAFDFAVLVEVNSSTGPDRMWSKIHNEAIDVGDGNGPVAWFGSQAWQGFDPIEQSIDGSLPEFSILLSGLDPSLLNEVFQDDLEHRPIRVWLALMSLDIAPQALFLNGVSAEADWQATTGELAQLEGILGGQAVDADWQATTGSVTIPGAGLFTDTFDRPDELLEDSPEWEIIDGEPAAASVSGGAVEYHPLSNGGTAYVTPDLGTPNHWTEVTIRNASGHQYFDVTVRVQNRSNYIGMLYFNGQYRIFKRVNAGFTEIGASGPFIAADGDIVRLDANEDRITGYVNGGVVVGPITETAHITQTRQGVLPRVHGAAVAFDDYRAGPSTLPAGQLQGGTIDADWQATTGNISIAPTGTEETWADGTLWADGTGWLE